MIETVWLTRSDGERFCVTVGTEAYCVLVANGAQTAEPELESEPELKPEPELVRKGPGRPAKGK